MLRKTFLVIGILCVGLLIACGKTENTSSTAGNENQAATTTNSTTSTTSTSSASSTASADKIGVPECDDFIAKYDACVSGKVPEAQRAQYKNGIDQWRSSWKQLAANPATKGTLASACKKAAEQQDTAMKAYGCSFK